MLGKQHMKMLVINVAKITAYGKIPYTKVIQIVKAYNFAFGIIWIRHTMRTTEP
jgi:hypothetical protein